jgi:hypothetical protein
MHSTTLQCNHCITAGVTFFVNLTLQENSDYAVCRDRTCRCHCTCIAAMPRI